LIEAARARHPHIIFHVAEAMRDHPLLPGIVLACAERTQTIDDWRKWWKVAPEFCRNDTACPLFDTALCATQSESENPPNPLYKGELCSFDSSLHSSPSFRRRPESSVFAKTALLILVHGSPQEESNIDMYKVIDEVSAAQKYFYVQVRFLECNDPDIPKAIEHCLGAGAQRIVAVPYFLHAGRHVANDLPEFLEQASHQYPQVEFLMGDYLGHEPRLAKVLLELANQTTKNSTRLKHLC
jgi:hypothetical protein